MLNEMKNFIEEENYPILQMVNKRFYDIFKKEKYCSGQDQTTFFAHKGYLKCLKYAHKNGCPWNKLTCTNAALSGHIDCLQYAHESGCPWDYQTCENAAKYEHLDCLRYAHEHGCPWNSSTCLVDAYRGSHSKCMKYIHDEECSKEERGCYPHEENYTQEI